MKGYEFDKNRYLILKDEDLESVKVDSSAIMSVETFIDAGPIDPMYYDASYFLASDGKLARMSTRFSARPSPRRARRP